MVNRRLLGLDGEKVQVLVSNGNCGIEIGFNDTWLQYDVKTSPVLNMCGTPACITDLGKCPGSTQQTSDDMKPKKRLRVGSKAGGLMWAQTLYQ